MHFKVHGLNFFRLKKLIKRLCLRLFNITGSFCLNLQNIVRDMKLRIHDGRAGLDWPVFSFEKWRRAAGTRAQSGGERQQERARASSRLFSRLFTNEKRAPERRRRALTREREKKHTREGKSIVNTKWPVSTLSIRTWTGLQGVQATSCAPGTRNNTNTPVPTDLCVEKYVYHTCKQHTLTKTPSGSRKRPKGPTRVHVHSPVSWVFST